MKLTKTLLVTTLSIVGLLACASVRADDSTNTPADASSAPSTNAPPHRPMYRGPSVDHLAQILNLTADQKAKVEPIMQQQSEQMHDVFMQQRQGTLTLQQRNDKFKQIHEQTSAALKAVLTDEQFQKWQSMGHFRPMRTLPPAGNTNSAAQSAQ